MGYQKRRGKSMQRNLQTFLFDPEKHTECKMTTCHTRGGGYHGTFVKKYAKGV